MRRIWSAQLPNRDMLPAWMTKVDQVKARIIRQFSTCWLQTPWHDLSRHKKRFSRPEIERGAALIRCQFGDEKTWEAALQANGLSIRAIRREIAADLRTRKWIAGKIARDVDAMPAECRAFYDARPENFAQPLRLRASHLFLAAPMETPRPIIDAKRELIESLSVRLAAWRRIFGSGGSSV